MAKAKATRYLQSEQDSKLRELILFICRESEGDANFGSVKLNKLLFYSDFGAYLSKGKPITGQEYQKLLNGPAPRLMKPMQDNMIEKGELAIRHEEYHGLTQKRPLALREPDLSIFTAEEIDLVRREISRLRHLNATMISDFSHEFMGWQIVGMNDTIPYHLALIDNRELTEAEKERGLKVVNSRIQELLNNGRRTASEG